jgi:nucleoside-diphosphate-sugar epimerase
MLDRILTSQRSAPPLPTADLRHCAETLGEACCALRGARVLITGASGFVGTWLVDSLLATSKLAKIPLQLTVTTRSVQVYQSTHPRICKEPNVTVAEMDLLDAGQFDALRDITHVIHAASALNMPLNPQDAIKTVDSLFISSANLARWAVATGVQKLLFLSSGAVYGRNPLIQGIGISESSPSGPIDLGIGAAYALGKRVAELQHYLHTAATRTSLVIARMWSFAGPLIPLDGHFAFGNFIRDALRKRPITIMGDGQDVRSYLYASDLAVWLWTLLLRGNGTYNVGSDAPISIGNLAQLVDKLGGGAGVRTLGSMRPASQVDHYYPDITLAKRTLGLEVRIRVEESILRTIDWYRQNETPSAT